MSVGKTIPSGDADLYKKAVNVTNLADALIEPNKDKFRPGDEVLDIGCGDGYATKKLLQACPGIKVTAADYSQSMVYSIAGQEIPGIKSVMQADAGNLPISGEEGDLMPASFDKIFSLSALHWVRNFPGLVAGMATLLKPGGEIIAEFARQSPPELRKAIQAALSPEDARIALGSDPWQKTAKQQWTDELKKNGFKEESIKIEEVVRSQPLTGEYGMKTWLKMFAIPFFTPIIEKEITEEAKIAKEKKIIEKVETELKKDKYGLYKPEENIANPWHVDYYRLNLNAKKSESMTWGQYLAYGAGYDPDSKDISR